MNVKTPLGKPAWTAVRLGERKTGYMRGNVKSGCAAFHSPPTQSTIPVADPDSYSGRGQVRVTYMSLPFLNIFKMFSTRGDKNRFFAPLDAVLFNYF
jgi:hypothetical protein